MQQNDTQTGVVLGLDVGDVRIGVARAHSIARFPEPLEVIDRTKIDAVDRIKQIVAQEDVILLVVGLPAYKSGQEGAQAEAVRAFAKELQSLALPIVFVDESYTSLEADSHLLKGSVKGQTSNDAVAACLILERYFTEVVHV